MDNAIKYVSLENQFTTFDLGLASALDAKGHSVIAVEPAGHRAQFFFRKGESFEKNVKAYWDEELSVDALAYYTSFQTLKSRIHALKDLPRI